MGEVREGWKGVTVDLREQTQDHRPCPLESQPETMNDSHRLELKHRRSVRLDLHHLGMRFEETATRCVQHQRAIGLDIEIYAADAICPNRPCSLARLEVHAT